MTGGALSRTDSGFAVGRSALIGRSEVVDLAERRWADAREGSGGLLLIAGEAGIGKSRMLREVSDRIGDAARVLTGVTWPKDSHVAGALLLDLGDDLRRRGDAVPAARIDALLATDDHDDARARRVLLRNLGEVVLELLAAEPTIVRFEDLHWADELSLEVLARLAPALPSASGLVIATYRSDEVFAGTPLAAWRGRLLAQRLAEEVRLPRLDLDDTAALFSALTGRLAPSEYLALLHQRSDGIPLHIEELAVAGADLAGAVGQPGDGASTITGVPDTLADAVRVRADALDAETREVLAAAAVVGCRFDLDLLTGLIDGDQARVDVAMHALLDRHFIVETDAGFEFRHALVRDVVHDDLPPLRRRALHEEVAGAAIERHARPAYISEQFELAGLPERAHPFALHAARTAARVSAHREAARLYRRALRTCPEEVEQSEAGIQLHAEYARELAATDDVVAASTHYRIAIDRSRAAGDRVAAARLVPRFIAVRHLLGDTLDERCVVVRAALADLDALPGGGPPALRAELLGALASAHMLDRRLERGREFAESASALAREAGEARLAVDIAATLGSILVFSGRCEEGWGVLERAIAEGRSAGFEEATARAYRMAGSSASVLVEYERAEGALGEGIDYAAKTENWNDHHYLEAHLAHVRWAQGRWTQAEALASRALAEGGGITTRITALHVLGFIAMGRAQRTRAAELLGEARDLAERMGELQRLSPALWGLAESALCEGDPATAVGLGDRAFEASAAVDDAAYLFPFLLTGVRARLALHDQAAAREWYDSCAERMRRRGIPGTLPALDHAQGLLELAEGHTVLARELLERAAGDWAARDRFWEGTWALIDLARCAVRSRRPGEAAARAGEARARASEADARALARHADLVGQTDAGDAAGSLTAREFEVARLVASGSTNREIAAALVISPKTVSAHMEHILAKLGANRRTEIARWVAESGR